MDGWPIDVKGREGKGREGQGGMAMGLCFGRAMGRDGWR